MLKNRFDQMRVDVPELYESFPLQKMSALAENKKFSASTFQSIYSTSLLPLKWRRELYRRMKVSEFDDSGFREFSLYWERCLGGRPLWHPHDLVFLSNHYRCSFQSVNLEGVSDDDSHAKAWQKPELLYQFLHLVKKESAFDSVDYLLAAQKYFPNAKSFLEFGCATAPIATARAQFFQNKFLSDKWTLQDLETISFHYAAFRFRRYTQVRVKSLLPEAGFMPEENKIKEVIFCITVLEHVRDAKTLLEKFYQMLVPGGLLVFDYIKSDGGGLDTRADMQRRDETLDYLEEKFEILQGKIYKNCSMGLTIARKR